MQARVIPLMLIVATIACPMWCSSGLCQSSHGQAKQSPANPCCCSPAQAGESESVPACCRPNAPLQEDGVPAPCQCPDQSFCQGVCGGAVFEKPVELNDVAFFGFVSAMEAKIVFATQRTESLPHAVQRHWQCHGGNFGRSLRTLHMSYLC